MVKKVIIGASAVALLTAVVFGRDAVSYVATAAGWAKQSVRDSVPIEFEIERARKMVRDLVPDIRANMTVIAREEVEIDRLEKQIADSEEKVAREREHLQRLSDDLSSGKGVFQYAGRSYSATQVKTDLSHRFERFKTNEATLASLEDILVARQKGLDAARQKLEGMLAAKRQLEVDCQNLETRLKMVEAAQTTAEYNFDDSNLSRAKELITDLRTRLEVAEKLANSEGNFQDEIPMDEPVSEDIADEVAQYLQGGGAKPAEVAADTAY